MDVCGVLSLMEVSLTSSVHKDVSHICSVPDGVFIITSSNAGEGNVAKHIATRQDCC